MNPNVTAALITRTESGTDDYHTPTYTETVTAVPGIYWPGTGSEIANALQESVTGVATLCLPTGTDVTALDAVVPQPTLNSDGSLKLVDGKPQGDRYEIDGQPAAWPASPLTGWQPPFSVVLKLKRIV